MEFKNLLTSQLAGSENTEVVVSRVTVPPNTSLPKHWHPGEEFAYIIEGSLILSIENEEEKTFTKGEACVVPLKKIHAVKSNEDGFTVLVFRVHKPTLASRQRWLFDRLQRGYESQVADLR